jgi:hypothetical protein
VRRFRLFISQRADVKTGKGSQRLRAIVTRDKNDATTLEKGLRFCVMTQFTVIFKVP